MYSRYSTLVLNHRSIGIVVAEADCQLVECYSWFMKTNLQLPPFHQLEIGCRDILYSFNSNCVVIGVLADG